MAVDTRVGQLIEILSDDFGRFALYQEIPDVALRAAPELRELNGVHRQLALDRTRCEWFLNQFDLRDFSLVEIGASIGYFSLSLAAERNARAFAYEPIPSYAEACNLLAELSGLTGKVDCFQASVGFGDLDSLRDSDLIVHLNVLHHAGIDFDQEYVRDTSEWESYSLKYLEKLARKYRFLFFQTGNKSKGPALFDGETAIPFLYDLLEKAGWEVVAAGVIDDLAQQNYRAYTPESFGRVPATACRRNEDTGLVDYYRNDQLVASLPTGQALRPLWYCRSRLKK